MPYDIENICRKIDSYEYVSFDIFDTLVKRNIRDFKDVFILLAREYCEQFHENLEHFWDQRLKAEQVAVQKSETGEPNLDEIYTCLEDFSKEQKENLKSLEIDLEKKICQCNSFFYPIYDYCLKKKKKIIIISDMYLPVRVIQEILSKCNIKKYDYLYVSNAVGLSKKTGKLFSFVLEELGIARNQFIHIGDSKKADFFAPRSLGISSILIPKHYDLLKFSQFLNNTIDENILYYFMNNNYPVSENIYYQLGFELLGPLLYGYIEWLNKQIKQHQISKIFFLAREGALLKQAFESKNIFDVEAKYLYVSRRSVRVPLLKNITCSEDVFKIVKMRRIIDLESFFINVGLDINLYSRLLEKYQVNKESRIDQFLHFEDFFKEIRTDICQNAIEEEKVLFQYLLQEEVNGHFAVADVGWVGTMQNSLDEILNRHEISHEMLGFYFGLNPKYQELNCRNNMFDYMFSDSKYDYANVAAFLNLFESFFLALHGSTKRYQYQNEKVVPEFADYEYEPKESSLFYSIQEGALTFFKLFSYELHDKSVYMNQMFRFGLNPKLHEIRLFDTLQYVETKKFGFVSNHSFFYYLFHLNQCYIDFCNCSWKVGYLKKLFRLPFNYYKLYCFLLRKAGK